MIFNSNTSQIFILVRLKHNMKRVITQRTENTKDTKYGRNLGKTYEIVSYENEAFPPKLQIFYGKVREKTPYFFE